MNRRVEEIFYCLNFFIVRAWTFSLKPQTGYSVLQLILTLKVSGAFISFALELLKEKGEWSSLKDKMRTNEVTSSRSILCYKRSHESRIPRQIGSACPRNMNERRENYAESPCWSLRAVYITTGHFSPTLFFSLEQSSPYAKRHSTKNFNSLRLLFIVFSSHLQKHFFFKSPFYKQIQLIEFMLAMEKYTPF